MWRSSKTPAQRFRKTIAASLYWSVVVARSSKLSNTMRCPMKFQRISVMAVVRERGRGTETGRTSVRTRQAIGGGKAPVRKRRKKEEKGRRGRGWAFAQEQSWTLELKASSGGGKEKGVSSRRMKRRVLYTPDAGRLRPRKV